MFFGYERRIHKAQRVFQGFKEWGSLLVVRLLMSFIFSFAALLLFCPLFSFYFFIALLKHTHFILVITFSCDLGMPLSIWVSWALLPFGFLTALSSFLIIEISLAPNVGCDPSQDFSWKKIYSCSKRDRKGCIYFRTWKE